MIIQEAQESFYSWQDHLPKYAKRHALLNPQDNVIAVLNHNAYTKDAWKEWFFSHNLVTVDGNQYYAERGTVTGTATNPFHDASGRLELASAAQTIVSTDTYTNITTPITASRKTWDTNFPKANDTDTDNTGAGVTVSTWKVTYTAADFNNATIQGGGIHDAGGSPVSGSKLLTHFSITSFAKASTDTLKMIINHTLLGV